MTAVTLTLISLATWLTPMPIHSSGKLIVYGSQSLVEANAHLRGYTLDPYREHCGVAVMSPSNLGDLVWLRAVGGEWYGPCLAVDVAQRVHFAQYVNEVGDIAEVSFDVAERLGFTHGIDGEVYVGLCPPSDDSVPIPYRVSVTYSNERTPSFCCPYPAQQYPQLCASATGKIQ